MPRCFRHDRRTSPSTPRAANQDAPRVAPPSSTLPWIVPIPLARMDATHSHPPCQQPRVPFPKDNGMSLPKIEEAWGIGWIRA
jgi:hypothetical protein